MRLKNFFAFFLLSVNSIAQNSEIEAAKMYYDHKTEQVNVSVVNGTLKIDLEVFERRKFNEVISPEYTSEFIYSRSFSEISDIVVYLATPGKNGNYKTQQVKTIDEKFGFSGSVFYGDDKYYEITFPNIEKGSYTEVSYSMNITEPRFFKSFFFSEYYPVKDAVYTITADTTIDFGWVVFGALKDKVVFNKELKGGKHIFTWKLENVPAIKQEENSAGYMNIATHVVIYIKSYRTDGKSHPVLRNVDDLYAWYRLLLDQIKPVESDHVKSITNQVIAGAISDLEKAKAIFYWVQDNIRYIAFEDGWRGFIPYPATEICEKRYGDCKDMSHLIFEMMLHAGLDAQHAWVGTRSRSYRYEETPCPNVDNHMIVRVIIDSTTYLLDATDAYIPFGVPSSFILSKQALFGNGDQYTIYEIPEYTPDFCTITQDITISAEGINVLGKASRKIETFEYSKFHNIYNSKTVGKEDYLKEYVLLGQNNFKMLSYTIEDTKPHEVTTISYDFEIPSYVRKLGTSLFINLNLSTPFNEALIKSTRSYDFELDFKKRFQTNISFIIPDGMKVNQLPVNRSERFDVGFCSATYELEGNKVIYERVIEVDRLVIEREEFDTWNNFVKTLLEIYNTSIEFN